MKRIHKLIWSAIRGKWIVVSEKAGAVGCPIVLSGALSIAALAALWRPAVALSPTELPTGGAITAGSASITTSGSAMTVNQTSQILVADWNSFNIGSEASVTFQQPGATASALNRIHDLDPSQIMGKLTANGQLFLINQSGIIFGKTAQVNVGGIVATSLDMADRDFLTARYRFSSAGSAGPVINQGVIEAMPGGVVALISPQVENDGVIQANGGSAALLAGDKVSLDFGGDDMINLVIDQGAVQAQASNKGLIQADGGVAVMSARAASELARAAVNNTGIVQARTFANRAGKIVLVSDLKTGTTTVSGTLDASAPNGGDGGFIETSGAKVKIADDAKIDTRATYGKTGNWLLDPTDFTISSGSAALTTSGIGATTLSNNLATTNVTLQTSASGTGNGDIFVNDTVSWSSGNTLTLDAYRNITVNSAINVTGTGTLALKYGQGSTDGVISGTQALFTANAPVNLASTASFSTQLGSVGATKNYTIISTLAQLQSMSLTGNYVLGADITASGAFTPIGGWISDATYAAAKNSFAGLYPSLSSYLFTGMFEGAGHTISNLSISGAGNSVVGLFDAAYSGSSQTIENLRLSGVNVSGDIRVGALAGVIGPKTTVYNVSVTGSSVTGMSNVGGFAGISLGAITSSTATENTVAQSGSNGAFTALQSTLGIFENYGNVGGFLGRLDGGTVSGSSSSGSVTAAASSIDIGGFAGYITSGSISQSYSTVNVTSDSNSSNIGGFVGYVEAGSVSQSYNTGLVTAGTGSSGLGGFAGFNGGTITNAFWDVNTSGIGTADSGTGGIGAGTPSGEMGKSTAELMTPGTYAGWDFANTWWMVDGSTRPFLRSEWSQTVTNAHQLQLMAMNLTASYTLANNIDLAPALAAVNGVYPGMWGTAGFSPIGNDTTPFTGTYNGTPFRGSFNGLGHTISNLTINRPSQNYVGLFGYVAFGGAISNVGLVGGSVAGYDRVGGLAGGNSGTVTQSYATGLVTASTDVVGGLMGENSSGTIMSSYATGSVSGGNFVGGLVGLNNSSGTITSSYATGLVTGSTYVGGLIGYLEGGAVTGSTSSASVSAGASHNYVGGFAGYMNGGSVTQSSSTGSVAVGDGTHYVGGFAGYINGAGASVTKSSSTGSVSTGDSSHWVGGFVGELVLGSIAQSYSTGSVNVGKFLQNVGGFAGEFSGGTVTQSYSTGSVNSGDSSQYFGGFAGFIIGSTVSESYSTGNVSAGSSYCIGGFAGNLVGDSVTKSYSTGNVSVGANSYAVAGFAGGLPGGTVTQSYSTGSVSAGASSQYVGGFVGTSTGTVTSSYWDMTTSGQATSDGGTGKTTAEMKSLATYAGWDISATGGDGKTWRIYEGQTTPLLRTFLTPLTVTGLSATIPVTYDGLSHTMPVSGTPVFTGFVGSDTSASLGQSQYKNAGTYEPWYSSKYDIILSGGNGTLTVNKAALTVTANNASKTYDGLAYSGGNGVTYSGFVNSESASVLGGSLGYSGTSQGAINADSYGIAASGLSSGNYDISYINGTLTIDPATLTYVASSSSRIYGDANPLFSGTITGWKNGETQASATTGTASWSTTATATSNAGNYAINGSGLVANNGNYVFAQGLGNAAALEIDPATLTYVADVSSRLYGDANPLFSGTITGWKNGETQATATTGTASWSTTATATSDVRNYAINGSGLVANNGNYVFMQDVGNVEALTINPANYTAINGSKVYDGNANFRDVTVTGVNGETFTQEFASANGQNAGNWTFMSTNGSLTGKNGAQTLNYNALDVTTLTRASNTATITQAPLTITANNDIKVYDGLAYSGGNGVTYSGFVNNENTDVLGGALAYGGTSQGAVDNGTYGIDLSGLTSSNYAISYVNGTLTIHAPISQPKQVTPEIIVRPEELISIIVYQSDQPIDQKNTQPIVFTEVSTNGVATQANVTVEVISNSDGNGGSILANILSIQGFLSSGFVLSLPPGVLDTDEPVTITLAGGAPLPSWLSFDPVAQTFTATDVPAGIQSLNIVISQGKQTWSLQIAAATPHKAT